MTRAQKIIKYLAIAFSVFLIVLIVNGFMTAVYYLAGFGNIFDDDGFYDGKVLSRKLDGEIISLDIRLSSVSLVISEGEDFTVETNSESLSVSLLEKTLKIEEKEKFFQILEPKKTLKITVPEGFSFDFANISSGFGTVNMEVFRANSLRFDIGAGAVRVGELYITDSAYIDGGTGKITVEEGRIKNAEIDVGVGVFEMKARLDGDSEIDCGIGRTVLKLSGLSDEYRLHIFKGIGSAVVDGVSVSDETYIGNGSSFVTVSGGIGSVEIIFVEN